MTDIISRRHDADGHRVEWWDNGAVYAVGTARREMSDAAAALLMQEICLYSTAEFSRACAIAKRAVEQAHLPPLEYFRTLMNGARIKYGRSAWGHVAAVRVIPATKGRRIMTDIAHGETIEVHR